jgi:hypothetical protein
LFAEVDRSDRPPRALRTAEARRLAPVLIALALTLGGAGPASAEEVALDVVEIRGARRTRPTTITGLLPRDLPALFTSEELEELDRRLNNLAIFDSVEVRVEGRRLVVELREKWTLIPDVEFTTGRTLADTYVSLGVTEYNLAGTAAQLGVAASWEQRGPNGGISWTQHEYSPRSGAFSGEGGYASSSFRFESGDAWYRDQAGGSLAWQPPYHFGAPARGKLGVVIFHERVSRQEGAYAPPSGMTLGGELEVSRDRYTWRDLAPSGTQLSFGLGAGGFVPAGQARLYGLVRGLGAVSPTETTALLGQVVLEVMNAGNANHSLLLSSQNGVRGLADAAAFAPMDAQGQRQPGERAFAAGGGLRLVPTWLAEIVVRVDAGRLVAPEARWFVQLGLNQYF